ncbi:MAG: metal-sulfur cluster assembly factor [Flavobacteriales bacterium]|nr:metal-sulfur cluster assembly factor [Flavobacteriales bacterium]MCL4281605.1 metal-sulfur cluster assembly factor [Flavobacteriales bacterium]
MNEQEQDDKIDRALDALRFVDDPEVGLNVVDLGLIYEIDIDPESGKVTCLMTFTTEFCPMGESIQSNVTEALKMTFPGAEVQVNITFDPPWRQDMISEAGRMYLGG